MATRGKPQAQRSVGPVLVWGLLSVLMAATGAATGYFVAVPAQVASAEPPVPKLLQVDEILAAGRAEGRQAAGRGYRAGVTAGRKRTRASFAERYGHDGPAYRRIFAEGLQAGEDRTLARFRLGDDGFYIVGIVNGGREVDASHGPLGQSKAYEVCRDGAAICVRTVEP